MWGMAPDGNAKVRPANMAWVSLAGCGECAFVGYKKLPGRACSAPWGVCAPACGRGRVVVASGHALPLPSGLAYLPSSDTYRSAHRGTDWSWCWASYFKLFRNIPACLPAMRENQPVVLWREPSSGV